MLNRYSLTHVTVIECGPIKTIKTFGVFFRRKAIRKMEETIKEIVDHGDGNLYSRSITKEPGGKKVRVHDTTHQFKIEKL